MFTIPYAQYQSQLRHAALWEEAVNRAAVYAGVNTRVHDELNFPDAHSAVKFTRAMQLEVSILEFELWANTQ